MIQKVHVAKPIGPGGALVRPGLKHRPKAQAQDDHGLARCFCVRRIGGPSMYKAGFFVQLPESLYHFYYTPSETTDLDHIMTIFRRLRSAPVRIGFCTIPDWLSPT